MLTAALLWALDSLREAMEPLQDPTGSATQLRPPALLPSDAGGAMPPPAMAWAMAPS